MPIQGALYTQNNYYSGVHADYSHIQVHYYPDKNDGLLYKPALSLQAGQGKRNNSMIFCQFLSKICLHTRLHLVKLFVRSEF